MPQKPAPNKKLTAYFERNGYFRVPDRKRRKKEGSQHYKKGYEIRFVARDAAERNEIIKLLLKAERKPVKSFYKGSQIVQPE